MTPGHVRPDFRMLPDCTWESEPFWTGGERGRLMIHRCRSCARYFHPPAPACFRCRSMDVGPEPVSGKASVAAFTVNEHSWLPGFPPPYVIAIVEIAEEPDVRLTTNVMDCEVADVHIGMPVEVLFEQWDDVWVPVFRPVAE
jgi:uncharacterized OB-fold protein